MELMGHWGSIVGPSMGMSRIGDCAVAPLIGPNAKKLGGNRCPAGQRSSPAAQPFRRILGSSRQSRLNWTMKKTDFAVCTFIKPPAVFVSGVTCLAIRSKLPKASCSK